MDRHELPAARARPCPNCGGEKLWVSGDETRQRAVCERCGTCWDRTVEPWGMVNSIECSGCSESGVCESRPTLAVRSRTMDRVLPSGVHVMVRPLLYSDRRELGDAYEHLSDESRRLRFFAPPKHLSASHLEYLTDLDDDRRFALVAFERDDTAEQGLGVARWFRDQSNPANAEAAVVVKDHYQRRGLGTTLLRSLVDEAVARGISTFTASVLWDNRELLDELASVGATIGPGEPGVATVELALPGSGAELQGTALHRALVSAAQQR